MLGTARRSDVRDSDVEDEAERVPGRVGEDAEVLRAGRVGQPTRPERRTGRGSALSALLTVLYWAYLLGVK